VPASQIQTHHISVCICTFKRPQLLRQLLERLGNQRTDGLFTYSVVVSDNDAAKSAQQVVTTLSGTSAVRVTYCWEPQPNIAMARNKALEYAKGDFIAFIDDDEFPTDDWLLHLFKSWEARGVAGVLGPVNPHFESDPPEWIKKGRFFDRPTLVTGYQVKWDEARTGNVLFKREILNDVDVPFRSEFATAGEDVDFFRRMMEKGHTFVWCNEAVVYEVVPASRCTRSYLLRRALLRGSNFRKHPTDRLKNVTRSLIAVPCYTLALPVLALFGQHVFLKYLIKLLDHGSRLLAYVGVSAMTRRQT
jgi:succinoglycan biosynthesis protein ExoM